jgi:hypothetical protein
MEASAQQCSTSQEAKDGDCVKGNTFKRRKPHLHRWLPPALRQWWQKLRAWAWYLLEELFEVCTAQAGAPPDAGCARLVAAGACMGLDAGAAGR